MYHNWQWMFHSMSLQLPSCVTVLVKLLFLVSCCLREQYACVSTLVCSLIFLSGKLQRILTCVVLLYAFDQLVYCISFNLINYKIVSWVSTIIVHLNLTSIIHEIKYNPKLHYYLLKFLTQYQKRRTKGWDSPLLPNAWKAWKTCMFHNMDVS